ncbi:MAG: EAL domain-containing protein, partial [Lachnospiraceae bacterium]|nr:EAL domain-containing protein [Lachnospiraceae bacterium]
SADIPAGHCGKICFRKLHEAITGETLPEIAMQAEILIGGSCGCNKFTPLYTKSNRDEWKTDHSEKSYYSDFNHITEDMLCQTQYEKFFGILATYSYQIRPFHNFWICLNRNFLDPVSFIGDNARRIGYDDLLHMVIKVGETLPEDDPDAVDLSRIFDKRLMLPELYEQRPYPTAFVFVPMFFEDRCFGYAVLNQGENISVYSETFRVWMRNVNQGIEAFYRQKALSQLIEQIKSDQIRDKQTGLYNYQGFRQKMLSEIERNKGSEKSIAIIALDIEDLKGINETYSRVGGDSAISAVSLSVERVTHDDEFCGRLSNDEFLIGFVSDDCNKRYQEMVDHIPEEGISFYDSNRMKQHTFIHHEMRQMPLSEDPDIDFLINRTVNAKNHSKKLLLQQQNARADLSKEMQAKCDRVAKILDNEDFVYHFQPIVRALDASVYAYEALMRTNAQPPITPLEVLECAQHLNRLYDVQRITFMHVLRRIEETPDDFAGKKVFINSLPAYRVKGHDKAAAFAKLEAHRGQIVVEYTESSEFTDEELRRQEEDNARMQIEVALDDYGSGY